jgi:hypothetical protein
MMIDQRGSSGGMITDRRQPMYYEKEMSQYHCVHHKSHKDYNVPESRSS